MGILTSIFAKLQNQPQNITVKPSKVTASVNIAQPPSSASVQPASPATSALAQPKPIKTLAELEAEILQAHNLKTQPIAKPGVNWGKLRSRLVWTIILLGIPCGVVYVANLPYPIIRGTVSEKAPLLLLPSYIEMDSNFKQAQAKLELAKQLITNPTSPEDLDLGEKKLKEAQAHLDALPVGFVRDWVDYNRYYWWYSWRFSPAGLQASRVEAGELEAKVFQEKNAQTVLFEADRDYQQAYRQYQQAQTPTDKRLAITNWQAAIDKLERVPSVTLAGKTARQKLTAYQRNFKETVGLAAGNEKVIALITAARQFSRQAAEAGQNPPHTETRWREIEQLWQESISQLERIPQQDIDGYTEARRLMAEHQRSLAEVRERREAEARSVRALEHAQNKIEYLLASTPVNPQASDRNRIISQLQAIINELDKVQNGTTVYLKAQDLKLKAEAKLTQLTPG
ncbi:hypothetical protein [Pseudanabaena sp. PCC 6802]|uniref:hypothetical protein n=1 Tax=Pseudanabaena sp. PCC 6802 TaxID=118173 RepID=UPI0003449EB6|nr:hypothetical protein [Pseudanabaena sp. PCC 6802]